MSDGSSRPAPPPGVLSIYAAGRSDPPPSELDTVRMREVEAIEQLYALGVRGTYKAKPWDRLQRFPPAYDVAPFLNGVRYAAARGFSMLVNIQVIDTHQKRVPPDLMNLPFDSPVLQERFKALLDIVLPQLPREVLYLSIGNEVESYLQHTGEWLAYKQFLETSVDYVHERAPWLRVGVTTTFSAATCGAPEGCALVNERTDLYVLTYYPFVEPFDFTYEVRPPHCPAEDFARMIELAKGKPVILQEVGYPAAAPLSSEPQQAQFVRHVFEAWDVHRGQIPYLSFFQMNDFGQAVFDIAGDYYKDPNNARLHAFISSLGLMRGDGSPRLAWQAFVEHFERQRLPRKAR